MQVLASQLHFLANKNAELAIPPLFWPVNCIKTGGHVALPSDPTVYSLYCAKGYVKEIFSTLISTTCKDLKDLKELAKNVPGHLRTMLDKQDKNE